MSKLSTLRHLVKYFLIGLTVCIVLVAAGLWGNQMYNSSLPLLIPTHPDLVSQTSLQTTAMPLEEARRIREPVTSTPNKHLGNYYYSVPSGIQLQTYESSGNENRTVPERDVIITGGFYKNIAWKEHREKYEQLINRVTPLRTFDFSGENFSYSLQIARADLQLIPWELKYTIVSEVTRNGSLLNYKGIWFDPSLYAIPLPPVLSVRSVSPDEPEFYSVNFNCPQPCTPEQLQQIDEAYGFAAMESFDGGVKNERFFENSIYATENQIKEAVSDGHITWYQRYDTSHWRLHYPEPEEMDKSVPIQITIYLPEDLPAEERELERKRIEQLVREYGGKTYEEQKLSGGTYNYKGQESELLIEKSLSEFTEPHESFIHRKNITDFIVPTFPAEKIWDLMQDSAILRVNRANVVHLIDDRTRLP